LVDTIVAKHSDGLKMTLPDAYLAATKQEVASDWISYEDAVKSLSVIQAHETPRADVRHLRGTAR
jgi:hypothetical protein